MKEFKDQMNNTIRLASTPRRIVSLVPSQTELLYDLGLENEVVGITKFCIHPEEWFKTKSRVGGTKTVDIAKVVSLKPDLIIGNKEENEKRDIVALRKIAPVWMSDIYSLEDSLEMINEIGDITDRKSNSNSLQKEIKASFQLLRNTNKCINKTVLYFIWNEPNLVAGRNTFIHDMLQKCGLVNLTNAERYPELEGVLSPDYVFLSSEPFPFNEKHLSHFQKLYPDSKIKLVDGEMFSWYGSRLVKSPSYFMSLGLT